MPSKIMSWLLAVCLLAVSAPLYAAAEAEAEYDGTLRIADGMLQPMLTYSDPRAEDYSNEGSDILRLCVYVETDHDTDGDGRPDLVKAFVQVPRSAAEGKYLAGTIYDPTPYAAGTVKSADVQGAESLYVKEPFDYSVLYAEGEKRLPAGEKTTLEAAAEADPMDWNYYAPGNDSPAYYMTEAYDYYLVRGYAVVQACGIGTYGSEGFELCGMDLERDSHKAVIEWLTGDRRAYTDPENNIEIRADWSNGKVAMTGCSYGGTMPFEVATTGVKGLETIIPVAGIADWYDYTNSQGIPIRLEVNYTDSLAAFNCGGTFLDENWEQVNERYGSYLWQISRDQDATNGDYAEIWDIMTYTDDWANIRCSALIVHGLNDLNVSTRHFDLMYRAFERAGQKVKLMLHQDGHSLPLGTVVNGELWEITLNRWLSHYLFGIDNGAEDMAAVTVQSNVDGTWHTYDSWRDFSYDTQHPGTGAGETVVTTQGLSRSSMAFFSDRGSSPMVSELQDDYYLSLDPSNAAVYEIKVPAGATLCGPAEVSVRLKTDYTDLDGLMISAIVMDTMADGSTFNAYITRDALDFHLPTREIGTYDCGSGEGSIKEYMTTETTGKCVTFGWTDLCNPGLGEDSSEYTRSEDLEAGTWYDYTFYMLPTIYSVPEGHTLTLILMAWDPCRAFLDQDFNLDFSEPGAVSQYDYSFTVDSESLEVRLPLAPDGAPEEAVDEHPAEPLTGYRVVCVDEDGAPVQGAALTLCTDTTCEMGVTDENGAAFYAVPEGIYTLHMIMAPEGFVKDENEYQIPPSYCETTITLKKAE